MLSRTVGHISPRTLRVKLDFLGSGEANVLGTSATKMSDYRGKTNYFGDRPMPIAGRTTHERERLLGMTMDERAWREKWCKDQELAPEEPKYLPELDAKLTNPIQKLYKTSLNWLFYTKLQPIIVSDPESTEALLLK